MLLVLPQETMVNTHPYVGIKIDILRKFSSLGKKKPNIIMNEGQYKQFL